MNIKKTLILTLALALILAFPALSQATVMNIVQDSTIILNGDFHGKNTSYVNDGLYADQGTRWSSQSVWWMGTGSSVEIDLDKKYNINYLSVQADSNDVYQVEYWDSGSGTWQYAWTVEDVKNSDTGYVGGLVSRSNDDALNIISDKLRITAVSGDNHFSVSEVQAYGAPAPAPPAIFMLMVGVAGVGFVRKRFASFCKG